MVVDESEYGQRLVCDFRFRFKECPHCGAENDIAARECTSCLEPIIDPDEQLKAALRLKNAMVIRCAGISFAEHNGRLKVIYHDEEGVELSESFDLKNTCQRHIFNLHFGRRFKQSSEPKTFTDINEVIAVTSDFTAPDFVVARKSGQFWRVKERIFDYDGAYRKANEM